MRLIQLDQRDKYNLLIQPADKHAACYSCMFIKTTVVLEPLGNFHGKRFHLPSFYVFPR